MSAPADHRWRRFVAVGDSITEGYGMDPVEGVEHIPWAKRVARELARLEPDLEFHNLGRRNLRAAAICERQLERAVALRPDLVSIAAGPNDLLAEDFGREQIERDLEPLYRELAATGADVFTFTFMNMPGTGLLPADGASWLARRMETLHAAIELHAGRHGALVIDLYADPESANPAFFSGDLQHANAAGQRYVADRTIAALQQWSRRRSRSGRPAPERV